MIIVTMTSWVKRIENVKSVVESIMNNTVKPDRIYLNLSKTEFDSERVELPKSLVDYFNSDERLVINWVEGENTKTMKKVFPILNFLDDDDIIINIDDDAILPKEFIEHRVNEFKKENKPITSCNNPKYHYVSKKSLVWSCSSGSIFQKKMLNGWSIFMNKKLIESYNDDWCYSTILWLNGYKFKPCSSFYMQNGSIDINGTKLKKFNEVEPMGKKHMYIDRDEMFTLLDQRVKELFNIGFDEAFGILKKSTIIEKNYDDVVNGFFSNNTKHDCVMVYGKCGIDSQEMTCGDHLEIEYVIASLKKYCTSWLGRIFVVGSEPPQEIKEHVIHVPCDNPYTHCKDANIIHKLRYACENIPDLSDDFLMISDDQIVTKESSWYDMKPRIVRMFNDWTEEKWMRNRKIDFWHECLYNTLKLFPKNTSSFWEPHIWSPINKYKFVEMCKEYDYKHKTNCITQSLYYNFAKQEIVKGFDHLHIENSKAKKVIPTLSINNIPRHLSWTDGAFIEKRFRDILDVIVGFNKSPKNEIMEPITSNNINERYSKIMQLRKDIANGKIIKVCLGDGKFVWKRIK